MSNNQPSKPSAPPELESILDAGGGVITITGTPRTTSIQKSIVVRRAKERGFVPAITSFDDRHITLSLTRSTPPRQRGAPKSEARIRLEDIKPGGWDCFDVDVINRESLRVMVQAVSRATGRKFITKSNNESTMVTRIDSLSEVSEALQTVINREISRQTKWPFGQLAVGEAKAMTNEHHTIESARSMAQHHKRKHGKVFSVSCKADEIIITRIS